MALSNLGINNFRTQDFDIDSGSAKDRVLNFYSDFTSELRGLMDNLMEEDTDLELGGKIIPAKYKFGASGTYLINEWNSEQEFIFSQLLENYKVLERLEKMASNAQVGGS